MDWSVYCTLVNAGGKILKKKYSVGLVKPYVDPALGVNDENATAYEEQPDDNAEDYNITEFDDE